MVPPNNSDDSQSDASDSDRDEIERMRLCVDNNDWDVFGEPSDTERDIQLSLQLLQEGIIRKLHRYSDDGSMSSTPNHVDVSPTSNPRFTEPHFLGAGAFGVVFRVHDELLGIRVSVKLLRPSRSNSLQLRHRFLAEAQATARLSHAGIVRIYETGQIGPVPYISTEWVDGGTLSEFLSCSNPSPRQSAWLLLKIADAVHHAHSKGVLHRDLKPSNILLAKSAQDTTEQLGFEPLLTDFGLAKRMDVNSQSPNLTSSGTMLGTLRYASPEQARGAIEEIDTTSDAFSLGIILYEMLVGHVPFDSPREHDVSHMINTIEPMRPRVANASVPRDLEAIVLKCLAKAKEHRYQTAHGLWLDLQRFLNGQPVEAQPSTWLRRLHYSARTHPVLVMISTFTIVVNLVALVGLYSAWTREHAALKTEQFAREQERIAKENERESKDREREVLVGIVSIFSEVGDLIQSGAPIKDEQWLTLLEKSSRFLAVYCQDNPTDESMLHRLSVLKHYLAITYQTVGRIDESWRERLAVESILTQLIESKPNNRGYLFQCFFSRLLIGQRLINEPALQASSTNKSGMVILEQALAVIRQLASDYPQNID